MVFADKMKMLIKEKGWSQRDFSRESGMDYTHANKFFTGRKPNMDFLLIVKRLFPTVDLNWLLLTQENDDTVIMVQEDDTQYQVSKAIHYLDELEEKISKLRVVLTQK